MAELEPFSQKGVMNEACSIYSFQKTCCKLRYCIQLLLSIKVLYVYVS